MSRFDAELGVILKRYPEDRQAAAMIPALRLGQEVFGWLSPAVQQLCADRLGTSPARAEEVATFYVMLETHPHGRHVVELCTNIGCCLSGSERIFEAVKRKLGVENGGTTPDGRITFREVECLGSCGTAPAMLVDEEMHERLTLEKVEKLLGGLK
ncbi:complex I 24 kDa subunit family protein [Anaeromyxobacter paludicola]|uniref:complex I 24 kDa subunit family protein n=1 Tax=Anaeromyxobacter paludicola TaxID=2918171 RepID=UPI0020BE31FD|nr:NAD(P)H-dependent oxidoreductase subunit E [Anaeromyxobacter paludicola]